MKLQLEEKQGQWGAPSKNCDRAPKEKSFSSSQQIANQLLRGTTHRTSACTFNERNSKQWNDAKKHQERTQQQNQKNRNSGGYDEKKKKKLIKNNDYHKREKKSNTKPPDLREENHPKKQRREARNSLRKKNDVKEQESQGKSMAAK